MKPGWQTTEFWITLVSQLLALLAITGVISVGDRDQLETALTSAVTAIFTLIASTLIVIRYIRSRTALKGGEPPRSPTLLLAVVAAALLAAPVSAAPVNKSCLFGRPGGTDPALLAVLQQIAQNQQTIIQLLQQRAAPPSVIVLNPGPPRQEIPLGGAPRQDIPLGGAPRQDIPPGPAPMQEVPLGPPPRQLESSARHRLRSAAAR